MVDEVESAGASMRKIEKLPFSHNAVFLIRSETGKRCKTSNHPESPKVDKSRMA
jgi:hypothetical protein